MRNAPVPENLRAVDSQGLQADSGGWGLARLLKALTLRKDFREIFLPSLETLGVAGGPSGGRGDRSPTPMTRPSHCKAGRAVGLANQQSD